MFFVNIQDKFRFGKKSNWIYFVFLSLSLYYLCTQLVNRNIYGRDNFSIVVVGRFWKSEQ